MFQGYDRIVAHEPNIERAKSQWPGHEVGPWMPRKGGYAIIRPSRRGGNGRPRKLTPEQEAEIGALLDKYDHIRRLVFELPSKYGVCEQTARYRYRNSGRSRASSTRIAG